MTPYYADAHLTVHQGDARAVLADLPAESIHCVVTSPPYWGLRDYGVPGQLGLEPTPEAYVAALVDVFREVRRVLRADGTVWLNLGDSYVANASAQVPQTKDHKGSGFAGPNRDGMTGLAAKNLVGTPWRVAFALQADGWYLRSDIIWAKPNPMPESVTDRPTKSHEYLFLLAKSPRYYWDADAVRERAEYEGDTRHLRGDVSKLAGMPRDDNGSRARTGNPTSGRNIRSVWQIATEPYPGAHFATFPRKLVEPCVKAGTSERGVCPGCGAPWVREVSVEPMVFRHSEREQTKHDAGLVTALHGTLVKPAERTTTGWRRSCAHRAEPVPATCLDPFAGTGTVGLVAQHLGRRAVLIDLSADYLVQCLERNRQVPLGLGA